MFPVYKGTYEREDDLKSNSPNTTSSYRDHVIAWSKDLGMSIDYLEIRPEIDQHRLAYYGGSWGEVMGCLLPAVEDRIKACVLVVGGFNLQKSLPEVDELNFAPRVKVPVLMHAEQSFRFRQPRGILATTDVPAPGHSQRTQAPRSVRSRP